MVTFETADGTRLACHQIGQGRPLLCLPGGPMQASAYLGDLGGLSVHRSLVLLDLRGTGASAVPADPASYRCDRQVGDVDALRARLGLDRVDLLAHSAGAALALLYAARHPGRVGRLALITPSPRPVGLEVTDLDRRRVAEERQAEPWFADAAAQAHHVQEASLKNAEAGAAYYAPGALDPDATRAAIASLQAPVLLLAGGYDVVLPPNRAAEYAALFPHAELAVQPGAGHFPWLDDPAWFTPALARFLP